MRYFLARAVAVIALAYFLGACALISETIDIKTQQPQSAQTVPPDSAGVAIQVKGGDDRVQYRDRVATKKNGYGVELAKIESSKSVAEIVRSAIEQEFRSRGYTIAPGGEVVTAEVLTFYSDFKPAFLVPVAESTAEVSFNLKVTAPDGGYIYGHAYRATGKSTDVMIMTPGGARDALERALTDSLAQLDQDQDLFSALTAKAPASPNQASTLSVPYPSSSPSLAPGGIVPASAAGSSGAQALASPAGTEPPTLHGKNHQISTTAPLIASSTPLPVTTGSSLTAGPSLSAGIWVCGIDNIGNKSDPRYTLQFNIGSDNAITVISYNNAPATIVQREPLIFTALNPRGSRQIKFTWRSDNSMIVTGPNTNDPNRYFYNQGACIKAS